MDDDLTEEQLRELNAIVELVRAVSLDLPSESLKERAALIESDTPIGRAAPKERA
jgi:hypothetical protein